MSLSQVYGTVVIIACSLCYYNSLNCGFVFDDVSAVKDNRDLRPHTPISNLFFNDFWGTSMQKVNKICSFFLLQTVFTIIFIFDEHTITVA